MSTDEPPTPRSDEGTDRRHLLGGLVGATALTGIAAIGLAGRHPPSDAETSGGTTPSGIGARPELLRHRLRRTTFGITTPLVEEVTSSGWDRWLDSQLDPDSLDDSWLEAALAGYETLTMSPADRRARAEADDDGRRRAVFELRHATLARAVGSRRQLLEVVVDHWHNHFNTDASDAVVSLCKADEDAAFRTSALGPFADLLLASASSPAMLAYLDNATSRSPSPNENYGRELLELHTVGVDGGYDETDVISTARVFTGWSIDRSTLEFRFRPAFHDTDPKSVLGWETDGIAGPDGVEEGRSLLRYLADHPATASHVTSGLVRRFVADAPPPAAVDAGIAAWRAGGGRIADVVRAILDPAIFDEAVGPKVSRPFEALATMLRRVDAAVPTDLTDRASVRRAVALHEALRRLGQPLFQAAPPTGFPDVAPAWVSTSSVSARWDLAIALTAAHEALGFDPATFATGRTVAGAARTAAERLWLRPPSADETDALAAATGLDIDDLADTSTRNGLVALVLATGVAHER